MSGGLTDNRAVVMARAACPQYLGVVDCGRYKPRRGVTIGANIRGTNMPGGLARRGDAVMAAYAIINNAGVIECRSGK